MSTTCPVLFFCRLLCNVYLYICIYALPLSSNKLTCIILFLDNIDIPCLNKPHNILPCAKVFDAELMKRTTLMCASRGETDFSCFIRVNHRFSCVPRIKLHIITQVIFSTHTRIIGGIRLYEKHLWIPFRSTSAKTPVDEKPCYMYSPFEQQVRSIHLWASVIRHQRIQQHQLS